MLAENVSRFMLAGKDLRQVSESPEWEGYPIGASEFLDRRQTYVGAFIILHEAYVCRLSAHVDAQRPGQHS